MISDLPFIAVVVRQIGEASTEVREMVTHATEQMEGESRRLLPLLPSLPVTELAESDS